MTWEDFIQSVYRILVPKFIRKRIRARWLPFAILKYYENIAGKPSEEIEPVLKYLKKNPLTEFPYDFEKEHLSQDIEVLKDPVNKLKYVLAEGKKLYFKRRWSEQKIRLYYNLLCKEQDLRSPHRYITEGFRVDEGDILMDVGTAEGNFALSNVEFASRIFLFETDKEWMEPLRATFDPWKEKVSIIRKFVSNNADSKQTRLDDYLKEKVGPVFLKIDVEGAESRLLEGANRFLADPQSLKIALCTYHKHNDEKDFTTLLEQCGYSVTPSDGFMLFYHDKKIKPPYFRRGLIRGIK